MPHDPFRDLLDSPLTRLVARQQQLNRMLLKTTRMTAGIDQLHATMTASTMAPLVEAAQRLAKTGVEERGDSH